MEVVEFAPDYTRLEAGGFVRQNVLRNIFKKLVENIVERNEIDKLRRIFLVGVGDVVEHLLGNDLQFFAIVPHLIEKIQVELRHRSICTLNELIGIITSFTPEVNSCKSCDGHIIDIIDVDEAHHIFIGAVRLKTSLLPDPFGTLLRYGLKQQFIAEFYLKLRTK